MMSLGTRITQMRNKVAIKQAELAAFEKALLDLTNSRVNCSHVWDNGVKGYEHEGKYCKKCGINDMHAVELKKHLETVANKS